MLGRNEHEDIEGEKESKYDNDERASHGPGHFWTRSHAFQAIQRSGPKAHIPMGLTYAFGVTR